MISITFTATLNLKIAILSRGLRRSRGSTIPHHGGRGFRVWRRVGRFRLLAAAIGKTIRMFIRSDLLLTSGVTCSKNPSLSTDWKKARSKMIMIGLTSSEAGISADQAKKKTNTSHIWTRTESKKRSLWTRWEAWRNLWWTMSTTWRVLSMAEAVLGSASIVRNSMGLGLILLIRFHRRSSIFSAHSVNIKSTPRSTINRLPRRLRPITRSQPFLESRAEKGHRLRTIMRIICKGTLTLLANTLTIKDHQQKNPSSRIKLQSLSKISSSTSQA